jgi:hypothetical protein
VATSLHFAFLDYLRAVPAPPQGRSKQSKVALIAEEVGFEPTVPRSGTPVFETGPFNHSGTPPSRRHTEPFTTNAPDGGAATVTHTLRNALRSWKNSLRMSPHSSAITPLLIGV